MYSVGLQNSSWLIYVVVAPFIGAGVGGRTKQKHTGGDAEGGKEAVEVQAVLTACTSTAETTRTKMALIWYSFSSIPQFIAYFNTYAERKMKRTIGADTGTHNLYWPI